MSNKRKASLLQQSSLKQYTDNSNKVNVPDFRQHLVSRYERIVHNNLIYKAVSEGDLHSLSHMTHRIIGKKESDSRLLGHATHITKEVDKDFFFLTIRPEKAENFKKQHQERQKSWPDNYNWQEVWDDYDRRYGEARWQELMTGRYNFNEKDSKGFTPLLYALSQSGPRRSNPMATASLILIACVKQDERDVIKLDIDATDNVNGFDMLQHALMSRNGHLVRSVIDLIPDDRIDEFLMKPCQAPFFDEGVENTMDLIPRSLPMDQEIRVAKKLLEKKSQFYSKDIITNMELVHGQYAALIGERKRAFLNNADEVIKFSSPISNKLIENSFKKPDAPSLA